MSDPQMSVQPLSSGASTNEAPARSLTPADQPPTQGRQNVTEPTPVGSPGSIKWNQAPDHVGQTLWVQGRVRWCETSAGHPARYSFDGHGLVTFEIAAVDRFKFTDDQLRSYCTGAEVFGTVESRSGQIVIPVTSPAYARAISF
jgi:hypothetical protein